MSPPLTSSLKRKPPKGYLAARFAAAPSGQTEGKICETAGLPRCRLFIVRDHLLDGCRLHHQLVGAIKLPSA
jgi:hypothetical protein